MNVPLFLKKAAPSLIAAIATNFAHAQDAPPFIPLWPDKPPKFAETAMVETINKNTSVEKVSIPAIALYLPPKEKSTGMALVVCPGGSYRLLDWTTHVVSTAQYFNSKGIAVIGLKYRTNPPNVISGGNREIPLLDVQRAIRIVRHRAAKWNIDPSQVGVLGYSAGANLAMTLASQFDEGDGQSTDPVQKLGCRPDFVVGCSTWHFRQKASPFAFTRNTPPVFLVHATNDEVAPIELAYAIKQQLEELGVPVHIEVFGEGGHGVGHLIPRRIEQNFPPARWPEQLLKWLGGIDLRFKDTSKTAPADK